MKIYSIKKNINIKDIERDIFLIKNIYKKYEYIINLGKLIFKMPKIMKIDKNIIDQCQSKVWFYIDFKKNKNKVILYSDSESVIIKGLISILLIFFNKKDINNNINKLKFNSYIKKTNLIKNFTINRSYGLIYIENFLLKKLNNFIK